MRPGSLVNEINHPPKFAATVSTTSPNNWPPGAAVSPIIAYTVTHSKAPKCELREINRIKSQRKKSNPILYTNCVKFINKFTRKALPGPLGRTVIHN